MSIIAVYAPTETNKLKEKKFYAKLESEVNRCPSRGTAIALGNFNAVTGTE